MKTPVKIGAMELELRELTVGDLAELAERAATRHLRGFRRLAEAGGLTPQEVNKAVLAEAGRIQALPHEARLAMALGGIESLVAQVALRSGRPEAEIAALPAGELMEFAEAMGAADEGLAGAGGSGS